MLILLSKGEKDTVIGMNNLLDDLTCSNKIISDRIKKFFINIKGLQILLLIMKDKRVSTKFISKSIDII